MSRVDITKWSRNRIEKHVEKTDKGLVGEMTMSANIDNEKYKEFLGHECQYNKEDGAIGGAYTYQFTPTRLSTVIKVRCECGEEKDITDYFW